MDARTCGDRGEQRSGRGSEVGSSGYVERTATAPKSSEGRTPEERGGGEAGFQDKDGEDAKRVWSLSPRYEKLAMRDLRTGATTPILSKSGSKTLKAAVQHDSAIASRPHRPQQSPAVDRKGGVQRLPALRRVRGDSEALPASVPEVQCRAEAYAGEQAYLPLAGGAPDQPGVVQESGAVHRCNGAFEGGVRRWVEGRQRQQRRRVSFSHVYFFLFFFI